MKKLRLLAALLILLGACTNPAPPEPDEPGGSSGNYNPTPYILKLPASFPVMDIPDDNPLTVEGIALGKKLYHDVNLSKGGPVEGNACASCHIQKYAFSSPSLGSGMSVMHHVNIGWMKQFLWKGEPINNLEEAMLFEVKDFFQVDTARLAQDTAYKRMFFEAFGSDKITYENMAKAISQYTRTLISANSKFDRYVAGTYTPTKEELDGMVIFFSERGDCFHCHGEPLFSDYKVHNIGLDSVFTGNNLGHFEVTGDPKDKGKFRTPTLRNVELTAPYMHDGRFKTLEEVVDFYSDQVIANENLDPILYHYDGNPRLRLTPYEKQALVAFLKMLTDTTFINNPEFAP